MNIVSIGEILWDVFEHEEHIGGAPFNFSAHAARLGHKVFFVSAVGDDERGRRARQRATELQLDPSFIHVASEAATGHVSVFVDESGQPDFTIHRPAAYDFPALGEPQLRAISEGKPGWIYFGTLAQLSPQVRAVTKQLIASNPNSRRLYDINLRKGSYNYQIVCELMASASILKINEDEVRAVLDLAGAPSCSLEEFCRQWSKEYGWEGVCVTRGAAGCSLFLHGEYLQSPGYKVKVADAVGAGDAFAAAFIHGVGSGWPIGKVADFANRLGALVASHHGAVPDWRLEEIRQLRPGA